MPRPDQPLTAKERRARRWPEPHNSETFALACRCLQKAERLAWHDISFVRAVAAIALTGAPTRPQRARLEDIAQRVGAVP